MATLRKIKTAEKQHDSESGTSLCPRNRELPRVKYYIDRYGTCQFELAFEFARQAATARTPSDLHPMDRARPQAARISEQANQRVDGAWTKLAHSKRARNRGG